MPATRTFFCAFVKRGINALFISRMVKGRSIRVTTVLMFFCAFMIARRACEEWPKTAVDAAAAVWSLGEVAATAQRGTAACPSSFG